MQHVIDLPGLRLRPDAGLRRNPVVPEEMQPDGYAEQYDSTTLIYDAARGPGERGTVITCPRLFDLWEPLRKTLPGWHPVWPWIWRHHRFRTSEHFFLRQKLDDISLALPDLERDLPVRPDVSADFADSNAVLLMNKDNPLDWIEEWAGYYVAAHGADAVVAFDNGSSIYAPEELAARLSGVSGITRVAVFSARFPFGPNVKRFKRQSSCFLQNAMMNMARLTVLARAGAVLNVDPDEIVHRKTNLTVFEAARRRRLAYVKMTGHWLYPAPGSSWPAYQREHIWRKKPQASCHYKWCARPDALMSRGGWDWHKLSDRLSKNLAVDERFELIHCRATTTGWKPGRKGNAELVLEKDESLADDFGKFFPKLPAC